MPGAFMQLVATGPQDVYLTGNPQTTFFKTVYRRHTNFSMECIKVEFKTNPAPNQRVIATIDRRGDLVHDCFIKVPQQDHPPEIINVGCNYGHNMIDYIECEIGGRLIDRHYGHWMEAHAELTEINVNGTILSTTSGSSRAGQNLGNPSAIRGIGHVCTKYQSVTFTGGIDNHIPAHTLKVPFYVPLRFWFCRHLGLSLPLIALQYHEVNINIKFSNVFYNTKSELWCNYIYLDTDERRRFAQVSHEYLIEQVQMESFTISSSESAILKLNFKHPVKELVWGALHGNIHWGVGNQESGKFTTFKDPTVTSTDDATFQLKLNGHDRFEKQPLTYFTRYQIMKYHTGFGSVNEIDAIGVYSFALKPQEHQPSGTCNFSRIDNAQLIYSAVSFDSDSDRDFYVYAVNYNVLRIMSGMGGLAYSN